jgi:hypothetical protein
MQTDNDLAPLLAPRTAADAADNINTLQALFEAQGRVLAALQAERRAVLLHGTDDALAAHDAEIRTAEVYRERCAAAVQALREREAELRRTERQAEAAAGVKAAEQARIRGVEIYHEFDRKARDIRELVEELRGIHRMIEQARAAAVAAGVSCGLALPAADFHVPDRHEEHITEERGPGIYDALGRPVGRAGEKAPEVRAVRHTRLVRGRRPADLTACEIVLPDPMDARRSILRQG